MKSTLLSVLLFSTTIGFSQNNFRVQITAMDTAVPLDYFHDLTGIWTEKDHNDIHRYYAGDFATKAEAEKMEQLLESKGYPYASVLDLQARKESCVCSQKDRFLQHLFFDFDRDELRLSSRQQLTNLASVLRNNPTYRAQLIGHTDNWGTNEYNISLSERRAMNAQSYLKEVGITEDRISIEYKGEVAPIAVNQKHGKDSPQGRQYNRRVIVQITDADGTPLSTMVEEIVVPRGLKLI